MNTEGVQFATSQWRWAFAWFEFSCGVVMNGPTEKRVQR